jgi:hypothetical protein
LLSPARQTLIGSAAIAVVVWVAAVPNVVVGFDGGYSSGLEEFLTVLTIASVALTVGALALVIQSWRGKVRPLYAVLASALAVGATLFLSVAMGFGG